MPGGIKMAKVEAEKLWKDGKIINWNSKYAQTHVASYSLHYGAGIIEGIRFWETTIFRLDDHVNRLFQSANIEQIKIPFSEKKIKQAIIETIIANRMSTGYIRPLIFIGHGELGLTSTDSPVHAVILVWQWGVYHGEDALAKGIDLKISSYVKSNLMLPGSKACANYRLSRLVNNEARDCGYADAVFLDERGMVAEASASNIFIVKGNKLITPPVNSAILPGITRNTVIVLARDLCYMIEEREFSRNELYAADECFICGTASGIVPVGRIDDRIINPKKARATTVNLQKTYSDAVHGRLTNYQHWLTPVQ